MASVFDTITFENETKFIQDNLNCLNDVIVDFFNKTDLDYRIFVARCIFKGLDKNDIPSRFGFLRSLVLTDPGYIPYKEVFYNILKEHNFNLRYEIITLMRMVSDVRDHIVTDKDMELINSSPLIKKSKIERDEIIFDTKDFGDYRITPLAFYFKENPEVYNIFFKSVLETYCHQLSWEVLDKIDDSLLITSLLPMYFVGTYYHTYLEHKDNVIDISGSTVMKKDSFDDLFQTEEIIRYDLETARREYEQIKNQYYNIPAPLALAVEKQRKKL